MADAARDLKAVFGILSDATPQNIFAQFRVSTPAGAESLPAKFTVRWTATPLELYSKFELQLVGDLFAETVIRQSAVENLYAKLQVDQTVEKNLFSKLVVRHTATPLNLYAEFLPRAELTKDLKATFDVGQQRLNLKTLSLINGFGNVVTEATSHGLSSGYIFGTKFTMGPNQSVGSKIVFWYSPDSIINYARGAIYTVSGNKPGTLIKETAVSGALSGEGWKELSFVEKPILAAVTEYFLLVWVNRAPGAEIRYSIPDSSLRGYTKNMGAGSVGSFSSYDPMPGGSERTYLFSIYATYDPATDATKDLFAEFTVAQGAGDVFAKLLLRQQTGDLKATFTLPETEDLYAKFLVAQDSKDLYAQFETQATKNLFAKFTVNQDFIADLFCELELYRPYSNLFARVYVVNKDTQELYSKFTVYNGGSEQLYAKALIAQPITSDLSAQFSVRNSDTKDLFSEFELQKWAHLKATFYISTNPNAPAYYPIIDNNLRYWMNYVQVAGRGFIGFPEFEDDAVDYAVPPNSLKISADRVEKGYKEFTFGWLYEGVDLRYWQQPPCVDGKEFTALARENWNSFEETIVDYTDLEKDNYLRRKWLTDFGAGGLTDIEDNFGASDTLKVAAYQGLMPGDLSYQWHVSDCIAAMKWDIDGLSGLDLARFAWARIELYRYGVEGSIQGQALRTDRMPDCTDIDVRDPPGNYGGCYTYNHSSTGIGASGVWEELTSNYHIMGDENMSFPQPPAPNYQRGNESFYASPTGYGLTWDNAVWDMADLSELMLGWLNGTYNNHGVFVRMTAINLLPDFRAFDNAINYYSRHAASANKPKLRVMLYPENLKWIFNNPLHWAINTTDPYSGTSALTLRDWTKLNYQTPGSEHTTARPSMVLKDQTPKEGYVETAFRLNTEELTDLKSAQYSSSPTTYIVEEDTPTPNYLNIYYRYQDEDNHYRVEFNKQGTNCRIIQEVGGVVTVLNTFNGRFKVGEWNKVRATFVLTQDGDFKCCTYKFDEFNNRWAFLAGAVVVADPYWPDGGEVRFEGLDVDLDETDVWEVQ